MDINKDEYKQYVAKHAPKSPLAKDCLCAFLVGGALCALAQALTAFYTWATPYDKDDAGLLTTITVVFLAALFTGIGIFDDVAKFAGAGTLVPVTGFANAVVSPAIDTKAEGWVLGVGAKIFTVAGPVILYGILSGALYGVVLWVMQLL